MNRIKVVVAGALGRMGSEAVKTFLEYSAEFELVGAVIRDLENISADKKDFFARHNINLDDDLHSLLHKHSVDVLVELTTPDSVFENSSIALKNGVRPVIGATGLSEDDIKELSNLSARNQIGAILAPNFALGAVLMMRFALEASKFYEKAEIIELHHDKKVDKPSGTALKTSQLMNSSIKNEIPIHSVRLPGIVANQEVIFGSEGETLTIEHQSINRSCFMPGIRLSCKKVMKLDRLIYGLENII